MMVPPFIITFLDRKHLSKISWNEGESIVKERLADANIHRGVTDLLKERTDGVREEVVTYTTYIRFLCPRQGRIQGGGKEGTLINTDKK